MPFEFNVPKSLLGMLFTITLLVEIRKPYLSAWRGIFKTIPWGRYLGLLVIMSIVSLSFLPFDESLLMTIQSVKFPGKDGLVDAGEILGPESGLWVLLYVAYFTAYFVGVVRPRRILFHALLGSVLTGLTAHLLKFAIMRARPDAGLGCYSFFHSITPLKSYGPFQSFPSGDVAVVAGAAVYLFLVAKTRGTAWGLLLLPIVTAVSRIDLNRHWPSDTFFSLGLGLVIGLCLRSFEWADADQSPSMV